MRLSERHPLIVWAKFGGLSTYRSTTLCELFWRVALFAPLKFLLVVCVGTFLGGMSIGAPLFGLAVWLGTGEFEFGFFIVPASLAVIALVVTIIATGQYFSDAVAQRGAKSRLLVEAYRGRKDNYCPVIEIDEGPR